MIGDGWYSSDDGAIHDYDQIKQQAIDLLRSCDSFVLVCSTNTDADDGLYVTSCVKDRFAPHFHVSACKEAAGLAAKSLEAFGDLFAEDDDAEDPGEDGE